jgi:tetratricopeptide (TPR) repeat protein
VASDPTVRETMRLMHLAPESGLTTDVTVEVAQRRGAPFAVAAAAFPLAGGASLIVRVLDAQDGRLIATLTADPTDQPGVLREVTRLARAARERITGSPTATPAPLPRVTTASLPALRNYVLARQALGRGDRKRAIELARGALVHDSLFALAHYFLGDVLWFVDQQQSSEFHLRRAYELSSGLPPRERLLIRARYEQLVLDRPDSAAVAWEQLRTAFPDDIAACEGLAWTYRSLGRFDEAVTASLAAIALDSTAIAPNARAALFTWYALGDTIAASRFARAHRAALAGAEPEVRWYSAMLRGDVAQAVREIETLQRPTPQDSAYRLQLALLAAGRLSDAERAMSFVVATGKVQYPPRALLAQAEGELGLGGSPEHAAALGREALAWLAANELSPPASARLGERIGAIAARAGDTATLGQVERLLRKADGGRRLRSFQLALDALAAQRAFARGAFADAARLAARAARETFLWRSMSPLALLEADALAAAGRRDEADARYRALRRWPLKLDADYETAFVTRAIVERRLGTAATQVGMRGRR